MSRLFGEAGHEDPVCGNAALYVIFVLALVHLAGAKAALAGRVTTLASAVVLAVSMVYDITLIAFAQSAALGGRQTTTAPVAYGLFAATEHVFLLVPPLFLALGLILLRTAILPRPSAPWRWRSASSPRSWAWPGCSPSPPTTTGPVGATINALVAAEAMWIAAASITLPLRRPHITGAPTSL